MNVYCNFLSEILVFTHSVLGVSPVRLILGGEEFIIWCFFSVLLATGDFQCFLFGC